MKATQIYLDDDTHRKMKERVLRSKDMTNQLFIIEAVKEKIERESIKIN